MWHLIIQRQGEFRHLDFPVLLSYMFFLLSLSRSLELFVSSLGVGEFPLVVVVVAAFHSSGDGPVLLGGFSSC